ncbi:bifunctional hydroxymethylpyrimidine kinase/phosphomethylpyrimidine kinase [Paenibacillus sp. sptzw28]|uniref:bifunctional hydroxymethylpyrimidine kinase/phosphomethylpyrimidine kinase n=1 Tax=Paenibacillus sp. sptzw28 TaxID=715179 RepID=UPI001C6E4500|nr:bifunctional hydroxymethylpyrimidine kinase/phosphomethylpyrimidine kinase [Paenibacillus sp. sptzw28]QYR23003.1 bifunctional hydroxymethylpyrimidine kinase/phosphomethylpyrimidine kinase [Paenibacillus sp. sptzw28]
MSGSFYTSGRHHPRFQSNARETELPQTAAPGTDFPPRVLTVAGSDSGGGAGIQADLKTCQELGVFGMSAITAVTAQNSLGVQSIYPIPPEVVEAQIDSVLGDIGAHAVKTGMLLAPDIVELVARAIRRYGIGHVVIDPVLHAKDGSALLRREALTALKTMLIPLAEVLTPNVPEACELLDVPLTDIVTVDDMVAAARKLLELGPRNVLLKGGHLPYDDGKGVSGEEAIDVFVEQAGSSNEPLLLRARRLPTRHTHGTGCTTASALAAFLAHGSPPHEAALRAKQFVTAAISSSLPLGCGTGSLWHAAYRDTH